MEETKQCPRCGNKVPKHVTQCRKNGCYYCFPMSCEDCGREVKGRVFCRECSESGIYNFQRTEALPPSKSLRPEEESVKKLVWKMLNDPGNEEIEED